MSALPPKADIRAAVKKCRYSITSSARANSAGGYGKAQRLGVPEIDR